VNFTSHARATLACIVGLPLVAVTQAGSTEPAPDPGALRVTMVPVVTGLRNPVAMAAPHDGSRRLFVVEKAGRIVIVRDGLIEGRPFLDITERVEAAATERGLLGLAFHPRFPLEPTFVVAYTARRPLGQVTYSRFALGADPDSADPGSERLIIAWDHPRSNHNGGHVAFGPDGYLYLGTGDGGGGGDPDRNGQDGRTLLGKMLRLDIDTDAPYAVPADNPFVDGSAGVREEIWALGLRNPWRYSFDALTGDLYIADVGQNRLEEVNVEPAGSPGGLNYGWNVMEGSSCYGAATCDRTGLTLPVAEYGRDDGCSVTGGYVYRGSAFPALRGAYFYADFCTNAVWALARDRDGDWRQARVGTGSGGIQSFGEDAAGELYVLTAAGDLLHLVDAAAPDPPPTTAPDPTPTAAPGLTATAAPDPDPTSEPTPTTGAGSAFLPWLDGPRR